MTAAFEGWGPWGPWGPWLPALEYCQRHFLEHVLCICSCQIYPAVKRKGRGGEPRQGIELSLIAEITVRAVASNHDGGASCCSQDAAGRCMILNALFTRCCSFGIEFAQPHGRPRTEPCADANPGAERRLLHCSCRCQSWCGEKALALLAQLLFQTADKVDKVDKLDQGCRLCRVAPSCLLLACPDPGEPLPRNNSNSGGLVSHLQFTGQTGTKLLDEFGPARSSTQSKPYSQP
jgi:hypothetical protein